MLQSSCSSRQPHHHHHQCQHQSNRHQHQCVCRHHKPALHQRRNYGLSWIALSLLVVLLFLDQCPTSSSLVVPNELPSLLSLVYSNIPPIKKGTDSRVGFGFRLGENADFQVLVELGPQKETRPIGNQDDADGSSFNKRQVNKTQQRAIQREVAKTAQERPANTWLEKWANQANPSTTTKKKAAPKAKPTKKVQLQKQSPVQGMPTMSHQMAPQAIQQLQMLYKMATSTTTEESLAKISLTTTTTSSPLSVVAPSYLQERLQLLRAPANADHLQTLMQKPQEQSRTEITKELMDVNLDE